MAETFTTSPRKAAPFPGPRGWRFVLSDHARARWADRIGGGDITHAVRFGRVIARQPGKGAVAVHYAPDDAVFVCREIGPGVFVVVTCVLFAGSLFHRAVAGMSCKQWNDPGDHYRAVCPGCGLTAGRAGCHRKKCPSYVPGATRRARCPVGWACGEHGGNGT